jgi:hypothetical protein
MEDFYWWYFRAQFKSVYTQEDHTNIPHKGPSPYSAMQNIIITENGVYKLLRNIKPHKATGPDNIPWLSLNEDIPDASCFCSWYSCKIVYCCLLALDWWCRISTCACLVVFWDTGSDFSLLYFAQSCSELDLRALLHKYLYDIISPKLKDNNKQFYSYIKSKNKMHQVYPH